MLQCLIIIFSLIESHITFLLIVICIVIVVRGNKKILNNCSNLYCRLFQANNVPFHKYIWDIQITFLH